MDKLTPSAQRTLDALNTGPGNVHELSQRTGRSRSTTDKAIGDLARAGLIVKVDDGGDPADGAPTRWQLTDPASADEQTTPPDTDGGGSTEPDTDTPAPTDAATQAKAADATADPQPVTAPPVTDDGDTDAAAATDPRAEGGAPPDGDAKPGSESEPDGDAMPGSGSEPDGEAKPDGNGAQAEAETPKLCRGCQAQMPKICDCCWQKTPAYCGKCRRTMPQVRRGEPGEPVILSNGLPKLRPGELETLVEQVMRTQSLPAFAGVVGWTGGRVAVHLPGRSTGAINNALEKLERTGVAELIGDKPMRYRLKPTEGTANDTADTNTADTDSAESAPDAEAGQPDTGA